MAMLQIKSPALEEGGWIPVRYTARGEDISPGFVLSGIAPEAKTLAITLDDASHPLFPNYNHWLIWNIPVLTVIPEAIPRGKCIENLSGATQGIAYGKNRYKGPKPPLRAVHTYVYTLYVLDAKISLSASSRKRAFLSAIAGHVLQKATLSAKFQSRRVED